MRMRIGVLAAQTARAIQSKTLRDDRGRSECRLRIKPIARSLAAHGRDAALRILQNTA
jgi:hypothetical protein